jgi:hypothetical protein
MAWNDPNEIRVSSSGQVYIAPVGTALPTTAIATLNAAFVGLGYLTTDGVGLTVTPQIQDTMAWQSAQPVRRDLTAQDVMANFTLQQFNEDTLPFAFGGGSVVLVSAGHYKYDLPTDGTLNEKCLIIDALDGLVHQRLILPRGNVTDAVETKFVRDSESQLPISFKALQPSDGSTSMRWLSDDAASFVAGS